MDRLSLVKELNGLLLEEMPAYKSQAVVFPGDYSSQRRLLRSLMNLRPPMHADKKLLSLQDELLKAETEEKGIVDVSGLPPAGKNRRLSLWRGDITRLKADAVVNAANSKLLGCFYPCHGCIDNAIPHSITQGFTWSSKIECCCT